jgi:hypothetical protein
VRQKKSGFALGLGFGSRRPVVQLDATTTASASSVGGSFALGYKADRVLLGVGLQLDYFAATTVLTSTAGTALTSVATTSFLVTPGVQVAIVRTAGGRLELLLAGQIGLGQATTSRTQDPALPMTLAADIPMRNFHLNYEVGPGLRVFLIPRLALTMLSGLAGDHFFAAQDSPSGLRTDQLSSLSIFGNLGMLGVF